MNVNMFISAPVHQQPNPNCAPFPDNPAEPGKTSTRYHRVSAQPYLPSVMHEDKTEQSIFASTQDHPKLAQPRREGTIAQGSLAVTKFEQSKLDKEQRKGELQRAYGCEMYY